MKKMIHDDPNWRCQGNHDDYGFSGILPWMKAPDSTLVILSVQLMIWIHLVRLKMAQAPGVHLADAPSFPWFYNLDSDICIDFSRS